MKKLFIGSLILFAATGAQAAKLYGMAGCGLGALAMGPDGGQVSAATTNSTSFNQGFGISSGTLNCLEPGKAAAVEAQKNFFVNNLDQLSKEMAQGTGSYVSAFAETFGCQNESSEIFASQMKRSYDDIFSAPGVMSMLSRVRSSVKSNQALSKSCSKVI